MRQTKLGVMAQLVARLNGIQKVRGSNPLSSTNRGGLLVVATKKGKAKAPFLFYCSLLLRRLMAPLRRGRNNVALRNGVATLTPLRGDESP